LLRKHILSVNNINKLIDSLRQEIDPAINKNFKKWAILDKNILWVGKGEKTYEKEIQYLKQWIKNRADWIDDELMKYNP
jgi:hypothetical protein